MAEYAITGDVATLLGDDHAPGDPAALWVECSQPILVVDSAGRIGGKIRADLDDDGTFTVGGLPESVGGATPLYRLHYDSKSMRYAGKRNGDVTGWFPLTADRDLTWIIANYVEVIGITAEVAVQVAAAAALGDNNNTMTASFIAEAGATRTALDARINARVPDAAAASYVRTYSPTAYGAAGNDSTDDTAALQSAITAAAVARVALDLRGLTYRTTTSLTVPAGARITNGTIRCTGTGVKILDVTGSNVALSNLTVKGRHATATASDAEHAIYISGASVGSPLTNIAVDRCTISLVGMYAIYIQHVDGFRVTNCDISDAGYTGIGTLSASNGLIEGCKISDILVASIFAFDGYGIHTSRHLEVDSLATSPRSSNIIIRGNHVSGVPWEGIDTHGGERIVVDSNTVIGCKTGIAMVNADGGTGPLYAALNFVVSNNVIDSLDTTGANGAGIVIAGAQGATSADPAVQYATGTITGNTIRNHGSESDNNMGAILLRNTSGVTITGNQIDQPTPTGICLYYDNRMTVVSGNSIADAWSTTVPIAGAVASRAGTNDGTLIGNTLRTTGARSAATYENERGFYNSASGTWVGNTGSYNAFTAAATPF